VPTPEPEGPVSRLAKDLPPHIVGSCAAVHKWTQEFKVPPAGPLSVQQIDLAMRDAAQLELVHDEFMTLAAMSYNKILDIREDLLARLKHQNKRLLKKAKKRAKKQKL
jgi:hypothetical protein